MSRAAESIGSGGLAADAAEAIGSHGWILDHLLSMDQVPGTGAKLLNDESPRPNILTKSNTVGHLSESKILLQISPGSRRVAHLSQSKMLKVVE